MHYISTVPNVFQSSLKIREIVETMFLNDFVRIEKEIRSIISELPEATWDCSNYFYFDTSKIVKDKIDRHRISKLVHQKITNLHNNQRRSLNDGDIGYDILFFENPDNDFPLLAIFTEKEEYKQALLHSGLIEEYDTSVNKSVEDPWKIFKSKGYSEVGLKISFPNFYQSHLAITNKK